MKVKSQRNIPENHPVKQLFRDLTERALIQIRFRDDDILSYLANLLVDFVYLENLYRPDESGRRQEYLFDMLQRANLTEMPEKKARFKHVGDFSLFTLGMFPEHIVRRRNALSANYYTDFGRIGYKAAGELESDSWRVGTFRKLVVEFESCVKSLRWVREYATDPFYQYMFRHFDIV